MSRVNSSDRYGTDFIFDSLEKFEFLISRLTDFVIIGGNVLVFASTKHMRTQEGTASPPNL